MAEFADVGLVLAALLPAAGFAALARHLWLRPRLFFWLSWRVLGPPKDAQVDPLPFKYVASARVAALILAFFGCAFLFGAVGLVVQLIERS
jgi:hypothetical protein